MPPKYKVAIIGTGFAERVQIPGFQQHSRFDIVAIAGKNPEHTREVAKKFGIKQWYTEWHELLAKGNFDLVSIVTPPHLHCEMTLAALDEGLHVLCEKPMALNSEEAKEMLDRARETGPSTMIDHEFRYLPARQRFGNLIRDGYIGQLWRLIICFRQSPYADPMREWSWWSDFEKGGGLLGAAGCHYFDAVKQWFRLPKRIWGKVNIFISERPLPNGKGKGIVTAEDAFLAVLDLGGGVEVLFDFTATAKSGTGISITALGSEGTLMIEGYNRLLASRGNEDLREVDLPSLPHTSDAPGLTGFHYLLDDLANGIDKGTSPSPNFEDGFAHQQFIDAVKISNALGTWIDFPPGSAPGGVLPKSSSSTRRYSKSTVEHNGKICR
jgi:predicted dehydrogenase